MSFDFRLIYDGYHDGASNMARDEAISRMVSSGGQLPTLRFYGWVPASISLGQSQRIRAVNEAACRADGVDVVRRATGGLAILHTDEFTYSISLPIHHPLAEGDVMTSYRRIANAIIDTLHRLGVKDASASPVAKADKATGPVCFEAPSDYEVVGGGKKLVGSAQWRRVDAVLQHGSLPLYGDIGRVCRYLVGAPEPERVRLHAATLSDVLGRPATYEEVAEAWRSAFADVLDIHFTVGAMTDEEIHSADDLRNSRYGNDIWNRRR